MRTLHDTSSNSPPRRFQILSHAHYKMLALSMPVMGFVPTIVPRSAPVRMQVRRTRA